MKLTTQGLIVIFCPLMFQLLLVAMLLLLLFQAQDEFEHSMKSEGVVNECNLITKRVFDGVGAYMFSQLQPNLPKGEVANELTGNFTHEVDSLHKLIVDDPAHATSDKLLLAIAEELARLGEAASHPGTKHGEPREMTGRLLRILSTIVKAEESKLMISQEVKAQQRTQMKLILACLALFGIAVSAFVAVFCALRLRRLIALMTENARRFSRREQLAPMMTGSDEVASVDQVFHAMDQAVEDALKRSRALIDNAADLVCSIDRDGYFERVNRFSRRLLGYEPNQIVGQPVIDLVVAEDCALADEQLNRSFDQDSVNLFDLRMKSLDERVVETSWSTFWSEADRSLFCVVGDVTERKNIEQLKQDFIAMISHDLRSPLMSVASSIALVQSGAFGAVAQGVEHDLQGAEKTLDRLIAMINDLLDFEKMEAGKMQFLLKAVAMADVTAEAFREVHALAQAKEIVLESQDNSLRVMADQEKLIQLLINLLANAIRYSPDGGVIVVRCVERDGKVEVAVLDDGPGVPKEFQETVFAPFENAPGAKQTSEGGTGLGLAICKLIVEGHNGEIGVRNRDVGGADFWFTVSKASLPDS